MTTAIIDPIKAPFPWFGGKSRAAPLLWERFGDTPNYVEPFAGSLAVLLGRPHAARTETVNDVDCYLANFWRALAADPGAVTAAAHHPVNEADLSARHQWLVDQAGFRERMKVDPHYHDPQLAGWWVWGLCCWIGSGWCANAGRGVNRQLPALGNAGRGVNRQLPAIGDDGRGVNRKLPHLGNAGQGVNRQLPHLGDAGQGVNRQLTALGDDDRRAALLSYLGTLTARLDRVRVCCGDWRRVLTPAVTERHGVTAILLDPPYGTKAKRAPNLYTDDDLTTAAAAAAWARAHGGNPKLRIALCGYEGEHDMPATWACVPWKAKKGYGGQATGGNENRHRERIWFSPHCLPAPVHPLGIL
jgi:DNA adenine methylase